MKVFLVNDFDVVSLCFTVRLAIRHNVRRDEHEKYKQSVLCHAHHTIRTRYVLGWYTVDNKITDGQQVTPYK